MGTDVRLLRDRNLLIMGEESVAMVTPSGWQSLPEPLASTVRRVVQDDDESQPLSEQTDG